MSSSSVPYSTERENALLTMAYQHLGRAVWPILPGNVGKEPQLNSIHLVAPENNLYFGTAPVAELCAQSVGVILTELCRADANPLAEEIYSELKTSLRVGYEGMANHKALQQHLDDTTKTLGVSTSRSSHSTLMQLHVCWVEASKLGLGEGHAISYGKRPASQLDQQLHWYCTSKAMKKLTKILNRWLKGEHHKDGHYFIAECIRALHIGTHAPIIEKHRPPLNSTVEKADLRSILSKPRNSQPSHEILIHVTFRPGVAVTISMKSDDTVLGLRKAIRHRTGQPSNSIFFYAGYHLPRQPEPSMLAPNRLLTSIPMVETGNAILPSTKIRLVHCFMNGCSAQTPGGLTHVEEAMGVTLCKGIDASRQPCDIYLSEGHLTSLKEQDMMEIMVNTGQQLGVITIHMHASCLVMHLWDELLFRLQGMMSISEHTLTSPLTSGRLVANQTLYEQLKIARPSLALVRYSTPAHLANSIDRWGRENPPSHPNGINLRVCIVIPDKPPQYLELAVPDGRAPVSETLRQLERQCMLSETFQWLTCWDPVWVEGDTCRSECAADQVDISSIELGMTNGTYVSVYYHHPPQPAYSSSHHLPPPRYNSKYHLPQPGYSSSPLAQIPVPPVARSPLDLSMGGHLSPGSTRTSSLATLVFQRFI